MNDSNLNTLQEKILKEMNHRGFTGAQAEYSGCGDSMDFFEVKTTTTENDSEFYRTLLSMDANDPLDDLICNFLEAVQPGFEIGEGSHGTLLFKVRDDGQSLHIHMDHTNIAEFEDDDAYLDAEIIEAITQKLRLLQVHACLIRYSGCGDSMDGYEFDYEDERGQPVAVKNLTVQGEMIDIMNDFMCRSGVAGFWDNEGGQGTIRISTEKKIRTGTTSTTWKILSLLSSDPPKLR
jgi:hypothetical protein